MDFVTRAIAFAQAAHAGQLDKQGEPYFLHLRRVMRIAHDLDPNDPHLHVAAVLHDVVEDTPVTLGELDREFGYAVMRAVSYVSHIHGDTYMERMMAIRDASGDAGRRARIIKRADLQDHFDTIHFLDEKDRGLEKRYLKAARLLGLHVRFTLVPA